jgi:hypothetical protein
MSDKINFEQIRSQALERIDRSEKNFKLAFYAAVMVEGLFLVAFLLLMEFSNRTHVLLLIAAIGVYSIVVLGLVALGAHFNRGILRVLQAIDLSKDNSEAIK